MITICIITTTYYCLGQPAPADALPGRALRLHRGHRGPALQRHRDDGPGEARHFI